MWPESPQFLCVGTFLPLIFRTHLDSNQNSFFGKCKPCGKQSLLEGRVHVLPEARNLQKGTKNAGGENQKQPQNIALKRNSHDIFKEDLLFLWEEVRLLYREPAGMGKGINQKIVADKSRTFNEVIMEEEATLEFQTAHWGVAIDPAKLLGCCTQPLLQCLGLHCKLFNITEGLDSSESCAHRHVPLCACRPG